MDEVYVCAAVLFSFIPLRRPAESNPFEETRRGTEWVVRLSRAPCTRSTDRRASNDPNSRNDSLRFRMCFTVMSIYESLIESRKAVAVMVDLVQGGILSIRVPLMKLIANEKQISLLLCMVKSCILIHESIPLV